MDFTALVFRLQVILLHQPALTPSHHITAPPGLLQPRRLLKWSAKASRQVGISWSNRESFLTGAGKTLSRPLAQSAWSITNELLLFLQSVIEKKEIKNTFVWKYHIKAYKTSFQTPDFGGKRIWRYKTLLDKSCYKNIPDILTVVIEDPQIPRLALVIRAYIYLYSDYLLKFIVRFLWNW